MVKCLERNSEFINNLFKSPFKSRKRLINKASRDNIDSLSEIALNILKGNVSLSPQHKKKLKKHKEKLRNLAQKNISFKKRKGLLVQRGGFLPLLLAPALSLLGGLAGRALGKALGI